MLFGQVGHIQCSTDIHFTSSLNLRLDATIEVQWSSLRYLCNIDFRELKMSVFTSRHSYVVMSHQMLCFSVQIVSTFASVLVIWSRQWMAFCWPTLVLPQGCCDALFDCWTDYATWWGYNTVFLGRCANQNSATIGVYFTCFEWASGPGQWNPETARMEWRYMVWCWQNRVIGKWRWNVVAECEVGGRWPFLNLECLSCCDIRYSMTP